MNPPDVYDAEGRPYPDRRRGGRRSDDEVSEEIERGFLKWTKFMFTHRALIGSLFTLAGLIGGYVFAMMGTPRELKAVERRVDSVAVRINRIEDQVEAGAQDRADIKQQLRWVIFMSCVQTRRADPTALPDICDPNPTKR